MKKSFEEWIEGKYETRGLYYISIKEQKDGWAESDLSHFSEKALLGKYNRYLK